MPKTEFEALVEMVVNTYENQHKILSKIEDVEDNARFNNRLILIILGLILCCVIALIFKGGI